MANHGQLCKLIKSDKKTSSNQPCGRDSGYIIGAFLKSFSIERKITHSMLDTIFDLEAVHFFSLENSVDHDQLASVLICEKTIETVWWFSFKNI